MTNNDPMYPSVVVEGDGQKNFTRRIAKLVKYGLLFWSNLFPNLRKIIIVVVVVVVVVVFFAE